MDYKEKVIALLNSQELSKEQKEKLENIFAELKESEDERIRKWCISHFNACINVIKDNDEYKEYLSNKVIAWLEKQGEKTQLDYEHADIPQKDFAPIEPKFHKGAWVVSEVTGSVYQIKDCIENVTNHKYGYDLTNGKYIGSCEVNHYHLWTIQDAKAGDVLINWNNTTFIFKAIEDGTVKFHIAYNEKWDTIKTPSTKLSQLSHLGLPEPDFEFHPATKEQRDLLFSKMKETGYEWDSEKKELKKIEVVSKESEGERIRKAIIAYINHDQHCGVSNVDMIAWLEKQTNKD